MAQKQEEIALEDYQRFSIKSFQFEKKNPDKSYVRFAT